MAPSGCLHLGVQLQPCPSVQSSVPQRRTAAETPPHGLPSMHRGKLLAVARLFVEDNADLESIIDLMTFRQHSNKLQGHLVLWRVRGTKQVRAGLAAAREKVLDLPHLPPNAPPPCLHLLHYSRALQLVPVRLAQRLSSSHASTSHPDEDPLVTPRFIRVTQIPWSGCPPLECGKRMRKDILEVSPCQAGMEFWGRRNLTMPKLHLVLR